MGETMGPSPQEMGLSEKDQKMADLKPGQPKAEAQQPEKKEDTDPRKQINDLDERLRAHYRGQWEADAPEDPEERKQILHQEFTDYSELTGFPVDSKMRLEYLSKKYSEWSSRGAHRMSGQRPRWTQLDEIRAQERSSLRSAEKASIDQKLSATSQT